MASFVDADAFVRWEKGDFDLPGWMESHFGEGEPALFPARYGNNSITGSRRGRRNGLPSEAGS